MLKFRKILAAVLAGAMLLGLAGCGEEPGGGTNQPGGNQTANTLAEWQTVADVEALELAVDELDGDYRVQIPRFVDAKGNAALTAMNERLEKLTAQYEESKADEGTNWEMVPLVLDTSGYLSVVLYQGEWPNYGTDGEASAYVYDKVTRSEVSEELAWSLAGATDDGVADALKKYCDDELTTEALGWHWGSFHTAGYYVDTDGRMALVLNVHIKPDDREATDPWDYLLVYKGGNIVGKLDDSFRTK